jgi:malonyl CoA-acyl carrier protein transacylase
LNDYCPFQVAYDILIELLAYQFASPVQWIQTQHLFFTSLAIERLIQIGPAPTLFTMAKRTLETGQYSPLINREIFWYNHDRDISYYKRSDVEMEPPAPAPSRPVHVPALAPLPA